MSAPNLQPTLEGPRVTVRPITQQDWAGLFEAAGDPLIWEQHPATDRYQEGPFREFFDGAVASESAFSFVDRESGKLFGSSRYNGYDAGKSEIEIGWTFIAREYWGGSYNKEIKKLMLEHAYTFVENVVFWVGDTNWRSQKAVEKIGGIKRDKLYSRMHGDVEFPYVVFDLRQAHCKL